MDVSQDLLRWLSLEQRPETNRTPVLCLFNTSFNWLLSVVQQPLERICPHLLKVLVRRHYSHIAKCRYYNLGSTRARTITRACVLVNMCHIKFALTGRKEGSEDRNAVGIIIELGSPFLQGISCLVKRWGPDRELWHSVLSHLGVLQLKTRTFSRPPSVFECKPSHRSDVTHLTPAPQWEQVAVKHEENCYTLTHMGGLSSK